MRGNKQGVAAKFSPARDKRRRSYESFQGKVFPQGDSRGKIKIG